MYKILEDQIMNRKWHEFLYCSECDERTNFLKKITEDNPIIYEKNYPMAIYLDTYGFENLSDNRIISNEEQMILNVLSREYIKNLIIYQIVLSIENNHKIIESINIDLINFINDFYHNQINHITSIKECLQELRNVLNMYVEYYNDVQQNGNSKSEKYNIPSFINIERFGKGIKYLLHNNEQFNIIIDHKKDISLSSIKAIMSLVNTRCASTICLKVSTERDKWPTYIDLNNRLAEYVHDYSCVELDNCIKNLVKK